MVVKFFKRIKRFLFGSFIYLEYVNSTKKYLRKTKVFNISSSKKIHEKENGRKLLMVIEQWLGTPLPFWQIYLASLLQGKGMDVTFLFTDSYFYDKDCVFKMSIRDYFIKKTLPKNKTVFLSRFEAHNISEFKDWIDYAVKVNTIHHVKGEFNKEESEKYGRKITSQLEWRLSRWLSVPLEEYDTVFFPGGLYSDTSFIKKLCDSKGIKYVSIDAGIYDWILATVNGVASQNGDIKRACDLFNQDVALFKSDWKKVAWDLFESRKNKKDSFGYQNVGFDEDENEYNSVCYLLMMNSVWDSAVLGINTEAFSSFKDFVLGTIEWVLENTEESITIRQHPFDRKSFQRGTDDYASMLQTKFKDNPRVRFIKAEDKVNSYKLMEAAKSVIVFSSTVAMEATILNKPVVCVSNCYYSDMGFVYKAHNYLEYINYLEQIRDSKLKPNDSEIEKALLLYFLTQKCNFVTTKFVPSLFHFKHYAKAKSVEDIEKMENVELLLKCIIENVPISYLNAKKILGK